MKCIHNKIGSCNGGSKVLSGGELKRLAFATEVRLINLPKLFTINIVN